MLAELDVPIYLKSADDLDRAAQRVFGVLGTEPRSADSAELGGRYYEAQGLGFRAVFYANAGEMADLEYTEYQYCLEITSQFACIEIESTELEGPLGVYYARYLAFELDLETATEVWIDETEEADVYEIQAFRRNPQYRLDQSPTTPKVFVVESRQIEYPFEGDEDDELDGDGDLEDETY